MVVIDAAKDELFEFIELCKPSALVAADELFVVIVPLKDVIEEFNELDVFTKEELSVFICNVADELKFVSEDLTSVMDAAKEALSKEPVPACAAAIVSNLPANEDEKFAVTVFAELIDAAKEELLLLTTLVKLLIASAAEELFVVTVLFMLLMEEFIDDEAA